MTLPSMLVVFATIIFLALERVFPGRELPEAKGWYWRALLVNLVQLGITLALARLWIRLFGFSLFKLRAWNMPLAEGFVAWFIGTFFFIGGTCYGTRMDSGLYSIKSTIRRHELKSRRRFTNTPSKYSATRFSARSCCIPCWGVP
jgi:hypothetical protein